MEYKKKKALVVGLGRSGAAAAKKLAYLGAKVKATDQLPKSKIDRRIIEELEALGIELHLGGNSPQLAMDAELVVVSPGISTDIPLLIEAHKRGLPVISEIELAARYFTKPIIAVTGTNGKTTTSTLIGEFLKAVGKKIAVAGNIGDPLILVDDRFLDFIVVEISSYQLETIKTFRPWISVVLNLSEDHLARHKNMEGYSLAKARIFMNQERTDYVIYNFEDPLVRAMVDGSRARLVPFSKQMTGWIDPARIKIKGKHNLENALAASAAAGIAGVPQAVIEKVLQDFEGVEHRIELTVEVNGVRFYNDSKATNPNSTIVALEALRDEGKIVLILGGQDKGGDLSEMIAKMKDTVRHAVLIGEASGRFSNALQGQGFNCFSLAKTMAEAVKKAYESASSSDVVLLSPACASFDMFSNFEERGRVFKEAAKNLTPK